MKKQRFSGSLAQALLFYSKKKQQTNTWLINKSIGVDFICGLFMLLFVYAACSKLLDYQKFVVQLDKSPMLAPYAHLVSWAIPSLELSIAGLLLFKRFQQLALYAAFSLMVIFSAYIVVILNLSEYIPCSCGGILENMNWTQHLYFNLAFVLLGVIGVLVYPKSGKDIFAKIGEAENLSE
jgi:hypothetical protein